VLHDRVVIEERAEVQVHVPLERRGASLKEDGGWAMTSSIADDEEVVVVLGGGGGWSRRL
jgi:hypothetical protein